MECKSYKIVRFQSSLFGTIKPKIKKNVKIRVFASNIKYVSCVGTTVVLVKQVLLKVIGKSASLSHNYATKSPLVTMGRPKFIPKTANSHLTITTPSIYTRSSTEPIHRPKRHPGPISRFATVHFWTDRLTDRSTGLGFGLVLGAFSMLHTHRHCTPPYGRRVYLYFRGVGRSIIQSKKLGICSVA